jgi:DNA polymerase III delta prime subunit
LSSRNPFINVVLKNLVSLEGDLSKVHKKALFYQKEYGMETTLKVSAFLKWKDPNKSDFYISPLFFSAVKVLKRRKIEVSYEIVPTSEDVNSNPILMDALKKHFDIELPEVVLNEDVLIKEIVEKLSTNQNKIELKQEFDDKAEWQVIQIDKIGNFNYKKSSLAKDFDEMSLEPSQTLKSIFGDEQVENLGEQVVAVTDLDDSQRKALSFASTNNIVIQGPPGTGKSQSIVNLISHFLSQNKKVLFVSQKRSALDVVYEKLKQLKLDNYAAYFNAEEDEKRTFYQTLRKSWDEMNNNTEKQTEVNNKDSDGILSFYLNKYLIEKDDNKSSYELTKKLISLGIPKSKLSSQGKSPLLVDWEDAKKDLLAVDIKAKKIFGVRPLGEQAFLKLSKGLILDKDPIIRLEKRIVDFKSIVGKIENVISKFNLDDSFDDLTRLAIAASIMSMVNKSQFSILNSESTQYKSFSSCAKKYDLAKSKYERQVILNEKWQNKPLKSEITELMDLVKHQHAPKGIFGILKRRSERIDRAFEGFDTSLTNTGKLQLLEELRSEWNLKGQLDEIKLKLKHNFEIQNPDIEIDIVFQVRSKLNKVGQSDYLFILEHKDSSELIDCLSNLHSNIQSYNHLVKFTFEENLNDSIADHKKSIEFLEANLVPLKLIINDLEVLFKINPTVLNFIRKNAGLDLKTIEANVVFAALLSQNRFEPLFDEIEGGALKKSIEKDLVIDKRLALFSLESISTEIRKDFQNSELLLSTPAAKLKEPQKVAKKEIKAQKKTLIHEIGKKQQHLAVKKFANGCWSYLGLFQKVWIMNPLSVSQRLPLEAELFDVVIFDEASQIPLEDSLPSIYRAKQIVVVGDEKQMPPSQFFSTAQEQFTVLDQAQLTFKKVMLNWHYRSTNPTLIKFSNSKFYDDNLLTFPAAKDERAIELKKVSGFFDQGSNETEADEIVAYLTAKRDLSKIGIITFSKEQEKLIRKKLLESSIQNKDLLIRNLENVQGIERDEIVISIGYSKNKEGVLRLNFGPVNQESGPNRLNVMFTRARQKMTIFSSIGSGDIGLSENLGVNCLREFLVYCESIENCNTTNTNEFRELNFLDFETLGLKMINQFSSCSVRAVVQSDTKKILLLDPCSQSFEPNDLKTIYKVLALRFREVKLVLSIDAWNNPERFQEEVRSFFN